ncbi:alpha/beta fold hydrolase [Idiomarina xiamenensis]|uniref:KANL3/Tex30 alpha/beta hydrolase-like domain-containing protein n=1 Tax=Idiomarina xiamenensis 10-D-4 TaxID=740709 RepID=K2KAL0_9GAMM|nr:alpha/beta fold hydrolase [Idiomarina xiamenensis]EKE84873.1 hypothetical protein A10D4_04655 [Idiomarina xiamenensis 10-D-4]
MMPELSLADDVIVDNPTGRRLVVFMHGAGADSRSEFMQCIATGLAAHDCQLVRFDFPYMQQAKQQGRKRPPNPAPQLDLALQQLVVQLRASDDKHKPLFLLGKSMGARVAFRCADALQAKAAIGLGFPFHPPGKPQRSRLPECFNQRAANLIIQGQRDNFCQPAWLVQQQLPDNLQIQWLADADHSLVPLKRSGYSAAEYWQDTVQRLATWIGAQT